MKRPDEGPQRSVHLTAEGLEIGVYPGLEALQAEWRTLERDGDCYAFQSYDWLECWQHTVGEQHGVQPCPVLVRRADGELLALFPLAVERRGRLRCLTWHGGALNDYQAPLLAADAGAFLDERSFAALWRNVRALLPSVDVVVLERQPSTVGAQPNPFAWLACRAHASSAHYTRLEGDLDTVLAARRSKRWLATQRRKERRLAEQGAVEFVLADEPARMPELLAAMRRQKSRSYRELGVSDLFARAGYASFVEELTRRHGGVRFAFLAALTVGGRVAATCWGLVHRQRFYYLLPTYERDELTRYSPGTVLLERLFQWCLDHDVEIFDFTIGDEGYKALWCEHTLALCDHVAGCSVPGRVYAPMHRGLAAVKHTIKASPRLWRAFSALRVAAARVRG